MTMTKPAALAVGVLAGERPGPSEIATAEDVPLKVMVDIAGTPMLGRVLDTVDAAFGDRPRLLAGPGAERLTQAPWLAERIARTGVTHLEPTGSPSQSVRGLLSAARGAGADALALTTGDHPLLLPETLSRFVSDAFATGADAVVGLADHRAVQARFPHSRRTALRFADGFRCGCNLFLFRGAEADAVLDFWTRVEQDRKRPDRILKVLSPTLAVRYLAGRLPLADALRRLSELTGAQVAAVDVGDPDAAVDVDNVEDLATVRARWRARSPQLDAADAGSGNENT